MTLVYTHESGYGNVDVNEVRRLIDAVGTSRDRMVLRQLLFDYEVLLQVVDGAGCVFRHADGSETRRIKLYV